MPYKHTLGSVFSAFFTDPAQAFKIIAILFSGALARWCMGDGNSLKRRAGDLIVCVLIYYFAEPFLTLVWQLLPEHIRQYIPPEVLPGVLAIAISLLGTHGLLYLLKAGAKFIERRFGVSLKESN